MKNNGTGIYYKPGLSLTQNSQFISDIGLYFDSSVRTTGYYASNYNYKSIFMELLTGYRKELFSASIVGTFRPILTLQAGSSVKLDTFITFPALSSDINSIYNKLGHIPYTPQQCNKCHNAQ